MRSRVACRGCGKPVLFQARGAKAKRRLHSDRQHDLCSRCWREAQAEGLARAAALPPFAPATS